MKFLVLLAVALVVARAEEPKEEEASPLERVTTLLEKLKDRIIEDGENDQKLYDKFACWCEEETQKKSEAIQDARERLNSLGQMILKLKGKVAIRTAEIKKLTVDIQENQEAQSTATSIREKENTAYQAQVGETTSAIAALEMAINVLKGSGGSALLQTSVTSSQAAHHIKSVIAALPSGGASVAPAKLMTLRKAASELELGGKTKYAPQSATIQGILTDMYSTMGDDLQSTTSAEASSNRDFEDFIATKQEELEMMQDLLKKKQAEKSEAEVMLTEAMTAYDDTEHTMQGDISLFDMTKDTCIAASDNWKARKELREQELDGIKKALEILTSDETKELFGKADQPGAASFLQTGMTSDTSAGKTRKAYGLLKGQATKMKSIRLAKVAAMLAMTKVGHFDKVLKAIDEMVETLKDEQALDLEKRDLCLEEYQTIARKKADLNWKIEVNDAEIEKLKAEIEQKEKELEDTIQGIKDVIKEMEDMLETRTKENERFVQAKKDDEAAIEVMGEAKDAMEKYYQEHAKFFLVQWPEKGASDEKVHRATCITESSEKCIFPFHYAGSMYNACTNMENGETSWCSTATHEINGEKDIHVAGKWGNCNMDFCLQPPDLFFKDKAANKNESKGIVEFMQMIIENLEEEIRAGVKAEEEAQIAYEKALAAAEQLKSDLEAQKINLEGVIAEKKDKKLAEKELRSANKENRTEVRNYKKEIKEECDWMIENYDKRRTARTDEQEALVSAKELLAGMPPPKDDAFVQHSAPKAPIVAFGRKPSLRAHSSTRAE